MITKEHWLNAGIICTWLVNILTINIYIIKTIDNKLSSNIVVMNLETYRIILYICSFVLVILYIIKLVWFLTAKNSKE